MCSIQLSGKFLNAIKLYMVTLNSIISPLNLVELLPLMMDGVCSRNLLVLLTTRIVRNSKDPIFSTGDIRQLSCEESNNIKEQLDREQNTLLFLLQFITNINIESSINKFHDLIRYGRKCVISSEQIGYRTILENILNYRYIDPLYISILANDDNNFMKYLDDNRSNKFMCCVSLVVDYKKNKHCIEKIINILLPRFKLCVNLLQRDISGYMLINGLL